MSHPEFMLPLSTLQDPQQRFVEVVRFYMAGWHVRPAGVRKPLNPILGEFCSGYWKFKDDTTALYIAEQVSHHVRPKSLVTCTTIADAIASDLRLLLLLSRAQCQD